MPNLQTALVSRPGLFYQKGNRWRSSTCCWPCLADQGWDPQFGARPLKRALQREPQDPLALKLLEGEFKEGDTIQVDAKPGQGLIFFRKKIK